MEVKVCLAVCLATTALAWAAPHDSLRERRSLKKLPLKIPIIGALIGGTSLGSSLGSTFGFGGGQSEPEIPDLSQYPLWKVHRYHGISLQPILLPGNEVHPYPPAVAGEPPSVVNVPNPHHAPQVTLPANEYGPPSSNSHPNSGPYPPPDPPGPYPPPSAPYPTLTQDPYPAAVQAPYPPADPPGPYPPPSASYSPAAQAPYPPAAQAPYPPAAQAPYSPAALPSAPYPPAYSTAYSSSAAHSGAHSTTHSSGFGSSNAGSATAHAAAQAGASAGSHASSGASASSTGSIGGITDSYNLPPYLPPEMVQKIQQYITTPEGRSKADILMGLISGAQNLKSSAASSLQSVMQRLFGGAGGSSNIALESGTYTNVPQNYPEQQGFFNRFRAVGTGVSGSPLPNLPEAPPLPSIPGLKKIPQAPPLPHINLPDISHIPAHAQNGQRYVSISLAQPAPAIVPNAPAPAPVDSYGTPRIPSTSYGTPAGPTYPYSEGGDISTLFQQSQDGYGVPGDVASAGSEDQEQFEPFVPEEFLEQEQHERDQEQDQEQDLEQQQIQQEQVQEQTPLVPLRTTKLHRVQVQDSRRQPGEDLRAYASRRPVYKGFRPMANQQAENEVAEDPEN